MRIIDLGGQWRLAQAGKKEAIKATVPGCVHTDLLAARKIEEPFYRDNETRLQWIGEVDWIYSRSFKVPLAALKRERVVLRCEGLDTLATIMINGARVGQTDNMFRTWEFDVKRRLKPGENTIEIRFASTLPYIAKRQKRRHLFQWGAGHKLDGGMWIRKEPCNYGWDWGPHLVTCGIWRAIKLVAFDTARLSDTRIAQDHTKRGAVGLKVEISAENVGKPTLTAKVKVALNGKTVAATGVSLKGGRATAELEIRQPQLWWPNGMGKQPLYDVTVELLDAGGAALDTIEKRIGLRTLRLDRHEDQWGESFQFAVNGVPFFAKGANWIPADTFAPRLAWEDYARLVSDAAAVNMNMLRVWGGGIYEDDCFYDLCDQLGICVWQDMMFACATYPAFDKQWMASVEAETRDNVRRLRHHPCIALWCGNNELEMGLVGDKPHQMSWADYGKLFDELLPRTIRALDPERDYWPCSPHSPRGDRADHQNPAWGDAHLWSVWHGRKPFEWYRTTQHRFCSEFGFQSFTEPKTTYAFTAPQDRNVTSPVMEHHQRCATGNALIMTYMLDWFRLPRDFDMTLWLSQVLHGMSMKYAVEHWRRNMPRTMGALYWQLNDCWPVASWASIDFPGRWKALHFMARHFFAPLLVSGVENNDDATVALHVTSDLLKACSGVVSWTLTTVAGKTVAKGRKRVRIAPRRSARVETLKLAKQLEQRGERDLLLWLELTVGGKSVSTNFVSFARPKQLELADPRIATAVKLNGEGGFRVTLKAQKPALWVWLELDGADARCSDNFFHLVPGKTVAIDVWPESGLTLAQFKKALRVRSLRETYTSGK